MSDVEIGMHRVRMVVDDIVSNWDGTVHVRPIIEVQPDHGDHDCVQCNCDANMDSATEHYDGDAAAMKLPAPVGSHFYRWRPGDPIYPPLHAGPRNHHPRRYP